MNWKQKKRRDRSHAKSSPLRELLQILFYEAPAFMQLAFSWWQLFDVLLSILWLISGVRDFMGKDPLIRLPFNQYERDPEYRAFWQKKNGVFYMLNSIAFLILTFIPVTSLIYRIIFDIAIVGDLLYLVAYEAWEHSAD